MDKDFSNAIEARTILSDYRSNLRGVYSPDIEKMYDNIDQMITELSKLEVTVRRSRNKSKVVDKIQEIAEAMSVMEQYVMMYKLMY